MELVRQVIQLTPRYNLPKRVLANQTEQIIPLAIPQLIPPTDVVNVAWIIGKNRVRDGDHPWVVLIVEQSEPYW